LIGKAKAPKAAELKEVDVQAEQKKAIAGNLANQDDIEALIARSNTFTQNQATDLMERAMPGYGALAKKFTSTASGMLDNPYALPDDVAGNISRLAAERGISVGSKGQSQDFSLLRDFGINSLEYGNSRINQAQSITSMIASLAPRVNPMSPMSMYITPAQQVDATVQNNTGQFNSQQAQNNANAAASNANASMWGGAISTAAVPLAAYFADKAATSKAVNSSLNGFFDSLDTQSTTIN
jgi:hypothetical protein